MTASEEDDQMLEELRLERQRQIREIEVLPVRDSWAQGMYDLKIHSNKYNSTTITLNPFELRAWGERMIAAADAIENPNQRSNA